MKGKFVFWNNQEQSWYKLVSEYNKIVTNKKKFKHTRQHLWPRDKKYFESMENINSSKLSISIFDFLILVFSLVSSTYASLGWLYWKEYLI